MKIYTYTESEWNEKNQRYEITYSESYEYEGEISQCGGGGGGGTQKTYVRYAPYVETHHADFLNWILVKRNEALNRENPFKDYSFIEVDAAFFGTGYVLSSFPSLYDMFGKFMAGLDIGIVWKSVFENKLKSSEINADVEAEIKLADEKMVKGAIADFKVSMRNINAVITSSFIIGKAKLEDKRIKTISEIRLNAKVKFLPEIGQEYSARLNWQRGTVIKYAIILKKYFIWKTVTDERNYRFKSKTALWPFTSLKFEQAALGTLRGSVSFRKTQEKKRRSAVSAVLFVASYTVQGACIGGWIGAVVGFVIGVAMLFLE